MAIHRPVSKRGIYFITFTCYRWLNLIDKVSAYDLIYDWFNILTANGHALTGYVIMPNHLHMLLYYSAGPQSLNTIVGNGKRFMGYGIIDRLKNQNATDLIQQLQLAVKPKDKKKGKKHEIWEESFDAKECRTERFVLQKLNYIHNNPCSGKWKLVDEPHHYLHSSALFYLNGKSGSYAVQDYRNYLSIYDEENQ